MTGFKGDHLSLHQTINLLVCLHCVSVLYSLMELQNISKATEGTNPIGSDNLESYVLTRPVLALKILDNPLGPFQNLSQCILTCGIAGERPVGAGFLSTSCTLGPPVSFVPFVCPLLLQLRCWSPKSSGHGFLDPTLDFSVVLSFFPGRFPSQK